MNREDREAPGSAPTPEELAALLAEFDDPTRYVGAMLFGSGARAALTRYSDLDLAFYTREALADSEAGYQLCYRRDRLISLSILNLDSALSSLTHAEEAILVVQGIRDAVLLREDTRGTLSDLQACAHQFAWTPELRAEAHGAASYHLMGNAEEVHKILRGLSEADDAALLNGAWGVAAAAPKMAALFLGVLSRGDNLFPAQVCEAIGVDTDWSRYYALATGRTAEAPSRSPLAHQAIGAFRLYEETARLLDPVLRPEHRAVVETAIRIAHGSGLIPAPEKGQEVGE